MRTTGLVLTAASRRCMYRGSKDQVQNAGAEMSSLIVPVFYRAGVFGNYLFFDKLDLLGGYHPWP